MEDNGMEQEGRNEEDGSRYKNEKFNET